MTYTIQIEQGDINWFELEENYRKHYAETKARLASDGIEIGEYNPRLDQYFKAFQEGWLINYVARLEGRPVGHANVYVTNDMHNGEKIAVEDMLYVVPEHRNGLGKKIVQFALDDLRKRGVKRVNISAVTDLRVAKIWKRMGFRDRAVQMSYNF